MWAAEAQEGGADIRENDGAIEFVGEEGELAEVHLRFGFWKVLHIEEFDERSEH